MITVNIMLPSQGDILKITCCEDDLTDTLMDRLKQRLAACPQLQRPWLCDVGKRHILGHDLTLGECGLTDGSSLIMI